VNVHDSGYKLLFSNRTIFRQLMESFVDQPWVKELDFDRAERVDKSFVDEAYQERESDLIYRIPFGDDALYVYVLLEFQSTVDQSMALRVLNYVVNLYMDLDRSRSAGEKLPPVFPIVLYNGDGRWTAATEIADLIEADPSLGDFALRFRYFKLAENEFTPERLHQIGNIVSTLFLAESRFEYEKLLVELVALFDREEDKRAVSLLVNWFRHMAIHQRIRQQDYAQLAEAYRSSQEVRAVLTTTLEEYGQKLYEKGREEGREVGREEGREEGVEEGLKKGRREIVLAMHLRSFPVELIADVTGPSVASVEEVLAQIVGANKRDDEASTDQIPSEPDVP